jgi:Tfp pilus assembly major pilin PilA
MIILRDLHRAGSILDSSKLAILIAKITSDIQARTKGQYIARGKISGLQMHITVLQLNIETNKYSPVTKNEQELLVGKISSFLNGNMIAHTISVK